MKSREKQIKKEVIVTLVIYAFYFAWWYFSAYSFGDKVEDYNYILGLPEWFFYSCVLGIIVINLLLFVVIKLFFKEIELD